MADTKRMVFDIETSGQDFNTLDPLTQNDLTKRFAELDPTSDDYALKLESVKNSLGLCPLTGEIITIGIYDCDKKQGIVLYSAPGEDNQAFEENGVTYIQKSESEMLKIFWEKAKEYSCFVSFNGRGFDAPWLMLRSAIHKIRPSKDIMSNRYVSSQKYGAEHIDLADLLTFYGAFNEGRKSLHLYCHGFGIQTPKSDAISGAGVGQAFKDKRYLEIARYNAADLAATCELYDYWNTYLRFS